MELCCYQVWERNSMSDFNERLLPGLYGYGTSDS
jgi:hypothetical protein